ncbi:signal transduction histidine kinase [Mizugakiibacter sediminis]|uniref:histidine kinase n=2 Tax=Mizugakiibacter sediminis TaxID=1475481 RepID=A0A0K8QQY1_9GAMM|nr:hybrid sensor histidine kinase/response regulator [Mizugakiibacter sediminis]GAP67116.1 signal transduction histidine kinase [Mizugakiibacter sediminis]
MLQALLLGAALAAAPAPAPLPTPLFRHYGVDDGLPSSAVYMTVQDREGFLWIGTRDGLARYDGVGFEVFRHDDRDPGSLPANDISTLFVDRDGGVWAGGEGTGLNRYDAKTQRFEHWRHDPKDPASLAGDDVWALAQTPDGALWVGLYAAGLDRLAPDAKGFIHLRHDDADPASLVSDTVMSLQVDAKGRLWIGTDAGLDLREPDGRLRHVVFPGVDGPLRIWRTEERGDAVLAATNAGVFAVDGDAVARRLAVDGLDAHGVYATAHDARGALWLATANGLDYIDADGRYRHIAAVPGLAGALPGAVQMHVLCDREGGLWFSSQDGGLAYLPPRWQAFGYYRHLPDHPESLSPGRIPSLAPARDGRLLVGGQTGSVDRLDPATGKVEHVAFVPPGLPSTRQVEALAEDAAGRLWIGQQGLAVADAGRVRAVQGLPANVRVQLLAIAADGSVYASLSGAGVYRVDAATLHAEAVAGSNDTPDAGQTEQMRFDVRGALWRATGAGMDRLSAGATRFAPVPGIAPGHVFGFAFADDGTLWLARADALEHYRLDGDRALRIGGAGAAEGWAAGRVSGLAVDARGRVWAGTLRELLRYDPDRRRLDGFGTRDGLLSQEIVPRALLRVGDVLYAGTPRGVIAIHAEVAPPAAPAPLLALTAISVRRDGRAVPLQPRGGRVDLRWSDRGLRIEARALSYVDPQRNRYQFRVDGFDADWVDAGSRGVRELAGLGAGDYRVEVRARTGDGAWGMLAAPLSVRVSAPPWNTPWAWAAYALAAALLTLLAAAAWRRRVEQRHRVALAEQQRRLAEEASAAKTRFLATMGHEIRTPMTGVLGMAELLLRTPLAERQREYAEAIQRSGTLLLKLVNDALDLARIEAGRFELESAPLDPAALLREVAELETGMAARKGLALRVEIAADAPRALRGDALRIQQVLLNLASNAIKFTERGEVRLALARAADGSAQFSVTDTGPGIPEASRERLFQRFEQDEAGEGRRQGGSGLGLAICRELVALMGGRIEVASAPGQGSTFRVCLPLPECAPPGDAARGASPAAPAPGALRVLLVEDDATVAQVIAGLLEAQGHAVRHAPHGLAALSELDTAGCDAMLLDLDLPGVDGFQLARMIRARERGGARLPIVAITARSGGDEEAQALAAGMDRFLRKPLTGAQLAEALHEVTDAKRRERNA